MPTCRKKLQTGFSLVEIMVGLVIGMLATVVIMQVYSVFEAQKRTTTGASDAQTNGSIALYMIRRDAEMAGFGLPVFSHANTPLLCDPVPTIDHDGNAATAPIGIEALVITDGGGGLSDTISIRYGTSDMGGISSKITGVVAGNIATITNNMACQLNDVALIANGAVCALSKVTSLNASTDKVTAAGVAKDASFACLGRWEQFQYAVNNGGLELNGVPSVAGIVNIQAQYGISATADSNQVVQWVNASGATWANPTVTNRNRIKAVRIAVVARNGQLEKTDVTSACSSLTAAAPTGLCAWDATSASPAVASPAPAIDLTADANWQRYRYRVYETIVPLRSIIWSREALE